MDVLVHCPASMGISYPCNAVWRLWALVKYHKMDVVLADMRSRWGKMSSIWENNTLQEFWTARPDEGSQWSHCAVAPLIALHQGIAGITPLTAGSGLIKIDPQPSMLSYAEFDVQTVKGAVHFLSKAKQGKRTLQLTLPQGVDAELWLDGRESVRLPFIWTAPSGQRVYRLVGGKSYEVKLRYT